MPSKIYVAELEPGQITEFREWSACQAAVSGRNVPFASGKTREEAVAKMQNALKKRGGKGGSSRPTGARKAPANKPKAAASGKVYLVELEDGNHEVFTSWAKCQAFLKAAGKKLPFGSGFSREEALEKVARSRAYMDKKPDAPGFFEKDRAKATAAGPRPSSGICSDAGTHGNPGPCEYQVTDLQGKVLVHEHLGIHTNNYAELYGIKAMIEYGAANGQMVGYTDSKIAMGWIEKCGKGGHVGERVHEREAIRALAAEIYRLKHEHGFMLEKWHTKAWGEIPADFGRK